MAKGMIFMQVAGKQIEEKNGQHRMNAWLMCKVVLSQPSQVSPGAERSVLRDYQLSQANGTLSERPPVCWLHHCMQRIMPRQATLSQEIGSSILSRLLQHQDTLFLTLCQQLLVGDADSVLADSLQTLPELLDLDVLQLSRNSRRCAELKWRTCKRGSTCRMERASSFVKATS